MDGTSLIGKAKRQKLNAEQDMDLGNKSIRYLPVVVLKHILSFLPTKDAVRTIILSKKWQNLWMSIPNLEFEQGFWTRMHFMNFEFEQGFWTRMHFMNFVETVLALRDSSDIKKFSLSCDVLDDAAQISNWVSAAVKSNVKELHIHLSNIEESFELPHNLFTCKTLIELGIHMSYILRLPSSISLSSLKILTLAYVLFPDDYSTQQLFALPTLEELVIVSCNWTNLQAVSISAPKLQRLLIFEMAACSLRDVDGCQVMIFGTGLTYFYCVGQLSNHYCFFKSSLLAKACIHVSDYNSRSRQVAYHVYKLLGGLCNIESLTLSVGVIEVLDYATELFKYLCTFINLTCLKFVGTVLLDRIPFWHIVYNSPHLRALKFNGVSLSSHCEENDWILDPVPPCFLSCLKSIEVQYFYGMEKELVAVKFLLKNAIVLEHMVITFKDYYVGGLEKKRKVREQLLELSGLSKTCKLVFI